MLGIRRTDRIRNATVLASVNRGPFIDTVIRRQLRTLGHWIRRGQDTLVGRLALFVPGNGRNRRGRPRLTYTKHVEAITGMTIEELREVALDRTTRPPD